MNDDYPVSGKAEPESEILEDNTGNGGPEEPESTGNGGPEEPEGIDGIEEIVGIEVTHTEIYDPSTGEGAIIDEYTILVDDAGSTEDAGGGPKHVEDSTGNGGPEEDE